MNIKTKIRNVAKKLYWLVSYPRMCYYDNEIPVSTHIGKNVHIANTKCGKYGYIAKNCIINRANIGNYVSIAPATQIGGEIHAYGELSTSDYLFCGERGKITTIGNDVWIAASCIIEQGVTIGQGAVVGCNSYVRHDVPPYAIVAGSPARIIKFRFNEEIIRYLSDSQIFAYPPCGKKNAA